MMKTLSMLAVLLFAASIIGSMGCASEETPSGPAPATGAQGHAGAKPGEGPTPSMAGGPAGGGEAPSSAATTK